jgi:phenylalanyl-tRNA synthetase alpha subunit
MRVRTVLITTALLSSILGAVAVYFVLTIPNDVQADAMLKQARQSIARGDNARGRYALTKIVQEYPRTNAAAAATAALVTIADEERQKLGREIQTLRQESADQKAKLDAVTQQVTTIANTPPKTITVEAPVKAPAKKTSTKHPTTSHRHHHRR